MNDVGWVEEENAVSWRAVTTSMSQREGAINFQLTFAIIDIPFRKARLAPVSVVDSQ